VGKTQIQIGLVKDLLSVSKKGIPNWSRKTNLTKEANMLQGSRDFDFSNSSQQQISP
jgi:hypothetical protein